MDNEQDDDDDDRSAGSRVKGRRVKERKRRKKGKTHFAVPLLPFTPLSFVVLVPFSLSRGFWVHISPLRAADSNEPSSLQSQPSVEHRKRQKLHYQKPIAPNFQSHSAPLCKVSLSIPLQPSNILYCMLLMKFAQIHQFRRTPSLILNVVAGVLSIPRSKERTCLI